MKNNQKTLNTISAFNILTDPTTPSVNGLSAVAGSVPMCCKGAMDLTYMAAHGIRGAVMAGSEEWKCATCGETLPYREAQNREKTL